MPNPGNDQVKEETYLSESNDSFKKTFRMNLGNPLDSLWFAYEYSLKNISLSAAETSEYIQPDKYTEYGFNPFGHASEREVERENNIIDNVIDANMPHNSVEEMMKLYENLGRIQIRVLVDAGRDYKDIYDSLAGEQDQELKAQYLFQYGGANTKLAAYSTSCKDKLLGKASDNINSKLNEIADDKTLTYNDLFNLFKITEEEKQDFFKFNPDVKSGDVNLWEHQEELNKDAHFENDDDKQYDLREWVKKDIKHFFEFYMKRGMDKEKSILTKSEKKLVDDVSVAAHLEKLDKRLKKEGKAASIRAEMYPLAQKLYITFSANNLHHSMNAIESGGRMGVAPESEIGGYYKNALQSDNSFIKQIVKDKAEPAEVIDGIVKNDQWKEISKKSAEKLETNFDNYIKLHTGARMGDTPDKQVDNLAKCIAAISLKKHNHAFNLKEIHEVADYYKEIYMLDLMKKSPDALMTALRTGQNVENIAFRAEDAMYGISEEYQKSFLREMRKLSLHMPDKEKRSTEYQRFYDAVGEAVNLFDDFDNIPAEQRAFKLRKLNLKIYEATNKYMDGKENVRYHDYGKLSYDHALDALAICTKYGNGLTARTHKILSNVNKVRNKNNKEAEDYIDSKRFLENYGADYSNRKLEDYQKPKKPQVKEAKNIVKK